MKLFMTGVVIALLFFTVAARASDPSIPTLKQRVADAQKQVDQAQQKYDHAKTQGESLDDSQKELARAHARLDQAKNQLHVAQQKIKADDSSQAIQPENRTQNGSNFSIRSQRDSENHPPLPASP
jgi:chromosome segregation ATPase